jgi:hypothetical protein
MKTPATRLPILGILVLAIFQSLESSAAEHDFKATDFGYVGAWRGQPKEAQSIGIGTAELIAPDWVITAKHVATKVIANPDASRVTVHFQTPAGVFSAKVVAAFGADDADVALARLDRPLTNVPVIALASNALPQGRLAKITMIGHSGDKHALFDRLCRLKNDDLVRVERGETGTLKGGDSGGAWISGGTNAVDAVLVGIVHGGGHAPEVSRLRTWIDATLAAHGGAKADWRPVDYELNTVADDNPGKQNK